MLRDLGLLAALAALALPTAPAGAQSWVQLGADIDGEAPDDNSGWSVSLSGDRLAVGTPDNDGNGTSAGHARVYEWDGTSWVQLGADIDGEAPDDNSGWSVSLSGDRLAVGAPLARHLPYVPGHARVYEWDGTSWVQLGADIDGETGDDNSGWSVSLSGDRLAVGAPDNDGNGTSAGHARVYEWDGTSWVQLGADIDGESPSDRSGTSVSLSGDRLAVGAPLARQGAPFATLPGHARVYEWDGTSWVQLGADIDGETGDDNSGWSVSLSGDRLAVGAPDNDGNGTSAGHARVYEWDGTSWVQLGADIDGESPSDRSGTSVSLSGDRLAVGAPLARQGAPFATLPGHARVYEWDGTSWVQLGADIDGETRDDNSGWSVSLSGDRLAVGAPDNDGNGTHAGHARVYGPPPAAAVASVTLDGAQGWRMLASPEATTVGSFLADLWTQGFPGADDPAGGCSAYTFDEAAPTFSAGWTCVADASDPLAPGEGLMVFVFEDDDAAADGVQGGFPKTLASSSVVSPGPSFGFSLAYTDDARAVARKGWNLLGTPSGTSFVWADAERSGVGVTVHVFDPAFLGGDYRTYTLDGTSGYGDLTGGIVPPFQGFFVQAVAPAPTLRLTWDAARDGQDVYGRGAGPSEPPGPPPAPAQSASTATAAEGGPAATVLTAVSPNPTAGAATVSWTQAEAGPVRLTVVDLLGRVVAVLADGPFAPGPHRATLAAGVAPGVYVVRLQTGATVEAARVVVAR